VGQASREVEKNGMKKKTLKLGPQASSPAALAKGSSKQRKPTTGSALVKRPPNQGKQARTPAVPVAVPVSLPELKERTREIIRKLKRAYPDAKCSLNHSNPFELLVATILSAQCTDERVNIVTADLFRKYHKPEDYLNVSPRELEKDIQSTGFFRNKTKSIQGASKMLTEVYAGEVPRTMDELLELPGVARKTANVVLGNAFDIKAGVVVDTHVTRLSHRLNLTQEKTAEKIEQALIPIVPRKDWVIFPHLIIYHGRKVCKARNPLCAECQIEKECPSSFLKTGVPPGM
jgi:endonuclease-3